MQSGTPDSEGLMEFEYDHIVYFGLFKTQETLMKELLTWSLLVLAKQKIGSEQSHIEEIQESLKDLKNEVMEICEFGRMNPGEYLEIINKCHNWISTNDGDSKQHILNKIREHQINKTLEVENVISYLEKITDSQRSVLRIMVHQNIQARVAFLRSISPAPTDSVGYYRCTNNPCCRQIIIENKGLKIDKDEITNKYNQLKIDKDEINAQCNQLKIDKDEINARCNHLSTINDKFMSDDKQLAENNRTLLELKDQNAQIFENLKKLNSNRNEYEDVLAEKQIYKQELEKVKEQLEKVKKEALFLQAELGDTTNFCLNDESSNSSLRLNKEIDKFNTLLGNFIKTKGSSIKIKKSDVDELLSNYDVKEHKDPRSILKFILQRIVIKKIFSAAEDLKKENHNDHLESLIICCTDKLIEYTTNLSKDRYGDDRVVETIPIKIRQQIYEALTLRGFNESNHEYICKVRDDIINELDRYREIGDNERINNVRKCEKVVRFGIKLWFRLQIQEPVLKVEWYDSRKTIETHLMEGVWDYTDNCEVELCYFPSIISEGEKEDEIYNKAQVSIRPKKKSMLNNITSGMATVAANIIQKHV